MGISFENPTPAYTLAFKLKTADIEIEKLDEYQQSQNFSAGTQFVIGWVDDPAQQYRYNGGKDQNWEELYNYQVSIDPDKYGSFNYVNGNKTYYPIMNKDGSNIRIFTVGDDDRLQTVTLANKTVTFVKENNKGDVLSGGKFALYDNEGNEMYQFTAKEEGVVLTGLSENESYSVKELEAPKGHDLNSKAVNFTVSTNIDDPTDKEDQVVTMVDKVTVVKTSDDTALGLMLIALMLSAGGLTALGIRRRENH